ncbi:hypothetical protein [Ottowia sp.]|uniref:hypothetical protein n=1 Tax=Ottowia sp. TaxID=1898956 RepID=UPI003A86B2B7
MTTKSLVISALIALGCCPLAYADSVLYYDSAGFETLGAPFVPHADFVDVSGEAVATLHPSTPQIGSLFGGATIETIWLNDGQYTDVSSGHGSYALGMMGSPVGTPVFPSAAASAPQITTNFDALAVPVDMNTCVNMESVTVNFDLSLSALGSASRPLYSAYYYDAVAPAAIANVFDAATIGAAPPLSSQSVVGTRTSTTPPFTMEWTSHSVTLPLTAAMLSGSQAYVTLSGNGSAAQGENTYIALDNVAVYRNTSAGTTCLSASTAATAVPTTSTLGLWLMAALMLGLAGYALRQIKST